MNAGGTAGSSGAASAAGTAGQGGSAGAPQKPEAELDGLSWTMICNKAADGNLCGVFPPGSDTCPADGYKSVDKTVHFGGTPGTTYDVTIHFQGTQEAGDYTGGTANPKELLKGATHQDTLHNWLALEVSAPAATYNPNAGACCGSVQIYDYVATIPVEAGATLHLTAQDKDCLMHRYCQNDVTSPCKGLVVDGISPANAPIDGAFLHMTVTSVVAR